MDTLFSSLHRARARRWLPSLLILSAIIFSAVRVADAETVTTYYHNDAAGTPVVATDANGAVKWRETHQPYGERLTRQADVTQHPLQFTGRTEDPDTGLIDEGARNYDPATAQFTGFDPAPVNINDPRSFTRYGYANNNPYRYSDPTGESPVDIAFLAADALKLSLAVYSGNAAAIRTAGFDFGASVVGVIDPVPFSGEAIKAAVYAKRAEAAAKVAGTVAKASQKIEKAAANGKRSFSTADRSAALEKSKDATGVPRCQYCRKELDPKSGRPNSYEADHANPYARGGPSTPDNLTPSCRTCNRAKGARTPSEWSGS